MFFSPVNFIKKESLLKTAPIQSHTAENIHITHNIVPGTITVFYSSSVFHLAAQAEQLEVKCLSQEHLDSSFKQFFFQGMIFPEAHVIKWCPLRV